MVFLVCYSILVVLSLATVMHKSSKNTTDIIYLGSENNTLHFSFCYMRFISLPRTNLWTSICVCCGIYTCIIQSSGQNGIKWCRKITLNYHICHIWFVCNSKWGSRQRRCIISLLLPETKMVLNICRTATVDLKSGVHFLSLIDRPCIQYVVFTFVRMCAMVQYWHPSA